MEKGKTILIIDDEPSLLVGLSSMMRRHGYQVISASNGTEGLALAKAMQPDLIISDVMMPPPNGFELRKMINQEAELASIPFIFLTARSEGIDKIFGIRQGADDYITKPFQTEELLARIEAIFRRIEAAQEAGREQMRKDAAQEMDKLRREILQNIHHEFRTPLTNIVMPLQLAVSHKFEDPGQQIEFIKIALSNLDRLESLVSDFIILTNIDQNQLNTFRQPLDPNLHLVKPIRKRLERYKEKNIELVIDVNPGDDILVPRSDFIHAVTHLADNAFKFSPPGGSVNIVISATGQGGITVRVSDQGPGIPKELLEKVFIRFYQISQGDSREFDGLGVGLTIAKSIAEANGGLVEFIPSPVGFSVEMRIPPLSPDENTGVE
jgi:two-component system sensor histidine kinase/response regulator